VTLTLGDVRAAIFFGRGLFNCASLALVDSCSRPAH